MAVTERGQFITLEGGEGAGKSTQALHLAHWLHRCGLTARITREPGGSPRAEALRAMLLAGRFAGAGPEAEALAFAVARADHLAETIRPTLAAGTWVICDRFLDSTWAYQGSAGADPELLTLLDAIVVGEDRPDLTLILDLPAETGRRRLAARGRGDDRFEGDGLALQEARRRAFLDIARREPERCAVVDASLAEEAVAEAIRGEVARRLSLTPVSA